jgi:NAD(P)-dependent dehydrogenase (short-subunit alcohol dehydrogenase family)
VVVLGGAHGLGSEVARAVLDQGAHVVIADDPSESGGQRDTSHRVTFVATDLDSYDALAALVDETRRRFGGVEALVLEPPELSVAVEAPPPEADWEALAGRRLRRAWLASRAFLPGMVADGRGTLLGLVVPGFRPGLAAFAAAQHGLMGLLHGLRAEAGGAGVQVLMLAIALDLLPEGAARAAAEVLAQPERFSGEALIEAGVALERAEAAARDGRAGRLAQAIAVNQQLAGLVLETEAEFDRLPVEVRPMARGGFASKVGYRTQDVVRALTKLGEQLLRIQANHSGTDTEFAVDYPLMAGLLARLLAYYQSLPDEPARLTLLGEAEATRPVRRQLAERERVIRELIAVLAEVRG